MEPPSNARGVAHFGVFEVDLERETIERRGAKIRLQDKPFQLLIVLLEQAGEVVTRETLRQQLWSAETFVEFDEGINAAIGKLRHALGDSFENPVFIETMRGKGYRWIAPVEWTSRNGAVDNGSRSSSHTQFAAPFPESQPAPVAEGSTRRILLATSIVTAMLIVAGAIIRQARSVVPTPEFQQRQVTVNSDEDPILTASISPDAKYLLYGDSHGLHLKLLETGEVRKIAEPTSLRNQDMYWGLGSWSPDSTRALAIANLSGSRYQAWTVSAFEATPTKLLDDAAPWVFSPDGSKIVFSRKLGRLGFRDIWQAEEKGNRVEKLFEVDENSQILGVQLSPDGKRLGYLKESQYDKQHEIKLELVDLSNGIARKLLSNEDIREFSWLSNGRILYTSCRTDIQGFSCNYGEVRLDPKTAEPLGEPRLLTQWAGFSIANTGATADGRRLAFQRETGRLDVYVADFDVRTLKLSQPRRLTHEEGMNFPTGWTRDGTAVLFGSNRSGQWGIYRQRIDNLMAAPVAVGLETISRETPLTPDGKWLLHLSYPKGSPWFLNLLYPSETDFSPPGQLSRIPIDGGPPDALLDNVVGIRCTPQAKGFCSVATRTSDGKALQFMLLEDGKESGKVLGRFEMGDPSASYDWDLSPDGRSIVVYKLMSGSIHLLRLSSGKEREIRVTGWDGLRSVKWSPDGRGLFAFCTSAAAVERDATLLYLDLKGEATKLWASKGLALQSQISPSPDGRHVAFTVRSMNSNVWLVENL